MNAVFRLAVFASGLLALNTVSAADAAEPLREMQLDPRETTVSGLSSGAYMAVQLHVAHSTSIAGAGVVAGGPYFCAEGQLATALNRCMETFLGVPNAGVLVAIAQALAGAGRIDPLTGLSGDRIYLFSGTRDNTVTPPVMEAAREFYLEAGAADSDLKFIGDLPAGHAFIVEEADNACAVSDPPFINDCDYDQAGEILQHVYGTLSPPQAPDSGRLFTFDQSEFLPDPESHGMASTGFIYIPEACETGEACRLHIAFAGCRQTPDDIGDLFARATGYNRWAESNRLVVLYPQSNASSGNPNGCWDWWGYDDPAYHTKSGRQISAVAGMAGRLGVAFAPEADPAFCERHAGWNWSHWLAGRAELCGWGGLCAAGSGERVGFTYSYTTLYESPAGIYTTTSCAP